MLRHLFKKQRRAIRDDRRAAARAQDLAIANSPNVVKLTPVEVTNRFFIDSDVILEQAKGNWDVLMVAGWREDENGELELYIAGNCSVGESLVLIEEIKREII